MNSYFVFISALALLSIVELIIYIVRNPFSRSLLPKPRAVFEITAENSPHYLIHTPGCTIPDIDPDHPSVVKYKVKTPQVLKCSKKRPLTEDSGLWLFYYEERLSDYGVTNKSAECYYEAVVRDEKQSSKYNSKCDKKWIKKKKVVLKEPKTAITEDGIIVNCVDKRKGKNLVIYKSVHFFIQPTRTLQKLQSFKANHGNRSQEQLSVIVFGTDAVSRGNLRRHMPKTFRYLKDHLKAIDFQAFNKVGDNTDPNLSAYLMGLSYDQLKKHRCTSRSRTRYDDCPFIWKEYADKGYATAYAEDAPWMGAFHFNKVGFCKQPTDYYNRPCFYASDNTIGHSAGLRGYNGKLCQGDRSSISLIHEYSLKVAEEMRELPYFGFYWTASMTHDYLKSASMADEPSLQYLKKLKEGGYLEHTVLFFLSDHGLRWGSFRSTYQGMLEERMPYVTIAFPSWFRIKYPEAMMSLRINSRRLTASFDIHDTLRDILNEAYKDPVERASVSSHGISLFREIPKARKCEDAGVPEHYCSCEHRTRVDPRDPHLRKAAEVTIIQINQWLEAFPLCVRLTLDKVLQGLQGSATNATKPKDLKTVATSYIVTFVTKPGGAVMESTLKNIGGKYDLTADVSRVNRYGNQSHCITDQVVRKYCYCKDLL